MAVKDLKSKKKCKDKGCVNLLWLNSNGLKLLEDKRSKKVKWHEELRNKALQIFMDAKANDHPYIKAHHLALQFVTRPISLKKDLQGTFPYYKRGVKGYLLETSALNLIPMAEQQAFRQRLKDFDVKLAWFPHDLLTLPKEYYRMLKKK